MHEEDHALGPVGQRIVFENEIVRVWEVKLEPGERQPLHVHELPYLVIAIEGETNEVQSPDGERRPVEEPPGNVVFRQPGGPHSLLNTGSKRYVSRLVELKR